MANLLEARRRTKRIHALVAERLERQNRGYHRELQQLYAEWERHPTPEREQRLRSLITERITDLRERITRAGGTPPAGPAETDSVPVLIAEMLRAEETCVRARARRSAEKYHGFLAGWETFS